MTDESTMRDHIEDLMTERAVLQAEKIVLERDLAEARRLLRAMELEAEQWWLLAAQYRNSGDHAGRCLGDLRCRLCAIFHRNENVYGKHHGASYGPL